MKIWQVLEIVRSNPIGNAAFKSARRCVHAARRFRNPDVPVTENISTVQYGGSKIAIRHRRTNADLGVIKQCFVDEQYEMPMGAQNAAIQAMYRKIVSEGRKPLIIDCGANIGASVLWFKHRYPQAHIVAIEPAPDNFALLQHNTIGLDVDLRRAGIAARDGKAHLADAEDGGWSYRTNPEDVGPEVEMIGFETLMESKPSSQYSPFILKIDIEGAESTLFSAGSAVFDRFPLIVIEPHDWMMPGQGTSLGFFRFHASTKREVCLTGENVWSIRPNSDVDDAAGPA